MTTSTFTRLSNYLEANDWHVKDSYADKLKFLVHKDENRILEIYDDSIPGAERYFEEAITFLAEKENKPKESFIELFCLKQGVMQIRVPNKTGEIDLETSLNLRNTAKKMITATSNSSIEKKLKHSRSKDLAIEKLKECKEIPAKAGSYIVTILIPEETGILDITQQALKTTSQLVDSDSIPSVADHKNLAEKGISSNFLDSFNSISEIAEKEGVDISFASGTEVFECKVNKEFCSYVKELLESITTDEKEKVVELLGTVKNNGWNEKENMGTIKINGNYLNSKAKQDFILQTSNYEFFKIANEAGLLPKKRIKITGTLIPGTKRISEIIELKIN
ncbi:MAG: hypothetical protein K2X69_11885 [Silvanigrellaceae bacterium]|nr:hypothetical protein [Silvanigrellaceae bacterium]